MHYNYSLIDKAQALINLEHKNDVKDLGVIMDNELNFIIHINDKINIARRVLGLINRNFIHYPLLSIVQYCS